MGTEMLCNFNPVPHVDHGECIEVTEEGVVDESDYVTDFNFDHATEHVLKIQGEDYSFDPPASQLRLTTQDANIRIVDYREDARKSALGIYSVTFPHGTNGAIAELHDGTEVPVELPDDWQCQAMLGGVVVWRHKCGTHVLGVPVCRRCG